MLASYEVEGQSLRITTKFSEDIVAKCRSWAGKYVDGAWVVPVSRLAEVQAEIGVNQDDQVEVEIGVDQTEGYGQIRIGWFVVAGRKSRDYAANVHAYMVAGSLPSSGGSVKNPAVGCSKDSRFRLWVPRDFAVDRGLVIVNDPAESKARRGVRSVGELVSEREELLARLAVIDGLLESAEEEVGA